MAPTYGGWASFVNAYLVLIISSCQERLAWQQVSKGDDEGGPRSHVLPLVELLESNACFIFIAEFVPDACSLSVVMRSSALDVSESVRVQLARLIEHCHRKGKLISCPQTNSQRLTGVELRSLSPDSFLMERDGHLRLVDFQNARIRQPHLQKAASRRSVSSKKLLTHSLRSLINQLSQLSVGSHGSSSFSNLSDELSITSF